MPGLVPQHQRRTASGLPAGAASGAAALSVGTRAGPPVPSWSAGAKPSSGHKKNRRLVTGNAWDQATRRIVVHALSRANAAAISEDPDLCRPSLPILEGEEEDLDAICLQDGECSFSVLIRRPVSRVPGHNGALVFDYGMCHHYTRDGQHCVTAGLGVEHANRCRGRLIPDSSGFVELATCGNVNCGEDGATGAACEVRCGPPSGGICSASTCPYILAQGVCPFGTSRGTCVAPLGEKSATNAPLQR